MRIKNKLLAKSFIIGLVLVVLVSIIGIMTMSRTHVVLQGQIEATEIRISGKLPGRVDSFLVVEGQRVSRGDTLVGISSPEAWAKLQQASAMENVAKYQNEKIDEGTRTQIEQVLITIENSRYISISQTDRRSIPVDPKEKRFRIRY